MHVFDQLIEAIENLENETAAELIRLHPELIHKRYREEQALHISARICNLEFSSILLMAGADVNSKGNGGESPLQYATRARQLQIVQQLLAYSPNLEQEDDMGFTALLLAARSGEREIAEELLKFGARLDFHSAVALGRAEVVSEMLKRDPNIYKSVRYKNDLLPDAVYADSPETIAVLLGCPWIDVHAYGLSGMPPLAAAVSASFVNPKMAELLLAHGADPNQVYGRGDSAIAVARRCGTLSFLGLR